MSLSSVSICRRKYQQVRTGDGSYRTILSSLELHQRRYDLTNAVTKRKLQYLKRRSMRLSMQLLAGLAVIEAKRHYKRRADGLRSRTNGVAHRLNDNAHLIFRYRERRTDRKNVTTVANHDTVVVALVEDVHSARAQCIAAGLKFNCGGKTEVTNVDNIRFPAQRMDRFFEYGFEFAATRKQTFRFINVDGSKPGKLTVTGAFFSGLFASSHLFPFHHAPIELTITLVSNPADVCATRRRECRRPGT